MNRILIFLLLAFAAPGWSETTIAPDQIWTPNGSGIREIIGSEKHILTIGNDNFVRLYSVPVFQETFAMPTRANGASVNYDPNASLFAWIEPQNTFIAKLSTTPVVVGSAKPFGLSVDITASDISLSDKTAIVANEQSIWRVNVETLQAEVIGESGAGLREIYLVPGSAGYVAAREISKPSPTSPKYIWNLELREITTGLLPRTFSGHEDAINDVVFSRDGTFMYSSSGMYYGLNLDGARAEFLNDPPSPDSSIRVWNLTTGSQWNQIKFPKPVEELDMSPDGQYLAASVDSAVYLLEADTLVTAAILHGLNYRISAVSFSSSGNMVYAGTFAGNIASWNVDEVLP